MNGFCRLVLVGRFLESNWVRRGSTHFGRAALATALLVTGLTELRSAPAPTAPSETPDQAAQEALKDIRYNLDHAEQSRWKSDIDPAIAFLNKYTGLGSDAVTVLSLNQIDKIWPAWEGAAKALDNFGVAYSVYNCLQNAYNGNYKKATLEGLKDFIKYRVGKMSSTAAVSASGVGLIDFALNSFGEAATDQIKEDFWVIYCQYQARQRPHLRNYIDLITKPGGGMGAVAAELDSFWDTPESAGVRGFYNLAANNPKYQADFRNRFIKEELLSFLQTWAERQRDEAEFQAYRATHKLIEAMMNTKVVVELAVLNRNLDAPPKGTAEICVRFNNPRDTTTVLAQQPIGRPIRFEVPLRALLSEDKRLTGKLVVRLRVAGETKEPNTSGENVFDVDLADRGPKWIRTVQPGMIVCRGRKPFYTDNWCDVSFALEGDPKAVQELTRLELRGIPGPTVAEVKGIIRTPDSNSVTLKNGQGKAWVRHGRYLVTAQSGDYIFAAGPIVVDGPGTHTVKVTRVAPADVDAPAPLSPDALRAALGQAMTATRQRAAGYLREVDAAAAALQGYWTKVHATQIERARVRRALELKQQEELKPPNLTSEQQQAIRRKYQPRIDSLQKQDEEFSRATSQVLNTSGVEANTLETERSQQRSAAVDEKSRSETELTKCANTLRTHFYPMERAFADATAPATNGNLNAMPIGELDALIAKARAGLATIEQKMPALIQEADRLPALIERNAAAVAAIVAMQEVDETVYYYNVALNRTKDDAEEVVQRAGNFRNSRLLQEARDFIRLGERRIERLLERRRARQAELGRLQRQIEEAVGQMSAPDAAAWAAATKGFAERSERLWAAVKSAPASAADDTAAFVALRADIEKFIAQHAAYAGDMLEPPARTETAYRRFVDLHEKLPDLQAWTEPRPDFESQVLQVGWKKINQRYAVTGSATSLREEIREWLALGRTAADRRTRLAGFLATMTAGADPTQPPASIAQRITQLEARRQAIASTPVRFRPESAAPIYEAERLALVRSGQFENQLLPPGRPRLIFKQVEGEAYGKAFYWPETLTEKMRNQGSIAAVLAVEGVDPDLFYSVEFSGDGGKTWRPYYHRGDLSISLGFDPAGTARPEILYRLVLPGQAPITTPAALPQYRAPGRL